MVGLSGLTLPRSVAVDKPRPCHGDWPSPKSVTTGRSDSRNVDFAFIQTCLSYGFRSNECIIEPFMPALDQAAAAHVGK